MAENDEVARMLQQCGHLSALEQQDLRPPGSPAQRRGTRGGPAASARPPARRERAPGWSAPCAAADRWVGGHKVWGSGWVAHHEEGAGTIHKPRATHSD